jgi:hypothetical protein
LACKGACDAPSRISAALARASTPLPRTVEVAALEKDVAQREAAQEATQRSGTAHRCGAMHHAAAANAHEEEPVLAMSAKATQEKMSAMTR